VSKLLQVIDQIAEHTPEEFVCPIPDAEQITVFSSQAGIPYQFRIGNPEQGWWMAVPTSESIARLDREAAPSAYLPYLEALERFYAIALFRVSRMTWVCVPFNTSDADQRGWHNGEPRQLHLVREAVQPFDVVDTRNLAGTLLFNIIDDRMGWGVVSEALRELYATRNGTTNSVPATMLNAYQILLRREWELRERLEQAERRARRGRQEAARAAAQLSLGSLISNSLEFMGADLVNWSEAGENIQVAWEYNGYTHSSTVTRNLRGYSAGICVDGTDSGHTLTSLVAVIEEARHQRRFDLPQGAHL